MASDSSEAEDDQEALHQVILKPGCDFRTGKRGLLGFLKYYREVLQSDLPDTDTPGLARLLAEHPLENYSLEDLLLEFARVTSDWDALEVGWPTKQLPRQTGPGPHQMPHPIWHQPKK